MKIIDYKRGNDEGGILVNGKDQYIAVTASTSKKFKSLRGAQKFLESYEYKEVRGKHSIGGTQYRSKDRNSRAEVYPGGQDEYGRDLFRVELREDNGHVEELYMTKTKLNRWLDQFGFKPESQVGQARKSKRSPRLRGRSGILVSFHRTNRGLKFEGEKPFSQIMSENSEYLYTDEDNINITRDESGKIVSEDDPNGETGELEYEYSDYYYTNRIYEYGDLSTDEIDAIKKTRYISDELRDIIN